MLAGLSAIARAAPQETEVDCWTQGDVPKSAMSEVLKAASYDTNTDAKAIYVKNMGWAVPNSKLTSVAPYDTNTDAKAILAKNTITNEQTGVNLEHNVDWRTKGVVTMDEAWNGASAVHGAVTGAVTWVATGEGSDQPSVVPSNQPSLTPSVVPSGQPSVVPSDQPSVVPSGQPSESPSDQPSAQPSKSPSNQPSGSPSNHPSAQPSPVTSNSKSQKKSGEQALGSLLAPTSVALPQNSYYGKKSKGSKGYYMKGSKASK